MKNTKALLLATILVTLGFVGTARAEHYGPLKSSLAGGQSMAGIGYAYDAAEWAGPASNLEMRQNQAFVQLGFGLGNGWELDLRGGAQDMTIGKGNGVVTGPGASETFDGMEFNGKFRPFGAVNFGGPLFTGKVLSIGPFVQGQYAYLYDDQGTAEVSNSSFVLLPGSVEASIKNLWTATAGLKFQLEIEGASLYFGPSFSTGGGTYKTAFISSTTTDTLGLKDDIEPERSLAGFAGIRWPLPQDDTYLDFELRFKDDMSGSLALNFAF